MSYKLQTSSDLPEPISDRVHISEVKMGSTKMGKEQIPLPQTNRRLKFQDKLKVENFISEKYVDSLHASRQNLNKRLVTQSKPSENQQKQWAKSKAMKDEELIKHMSNVPGYLQRIDRGENIQEKALNFGVLSWENLEKWKDNKHPLPAKNSVNSSSTSSISSLFTVSSSVTDSIQSDTPAQQRKQSNSACNRELFLGVKPPKGKSLSKKDSEIAPNCASDEHEQIQSADKCFGRKNSGIESSSLSSRNCGVSVIPKEKLSSKVYENVKRVEESQELDMGTTFVEHGNISGKGPLSGNFTNFVNLVSQNDATDSTPRTSVDSKYSNGFSPQMGHSPAHHYEVPHSCPLSSSETTESDIRRHSNAHYTEHSSYQSHSSPHFKEMQVTPTVGKYAINKRLDFKPLNSSVIDSPKRIGQVITEFSDKKVRNPSPNRRFSIGRMSRSLSFKEGSSVVPQLSSTYVSAKSGPAGSETSVCLDDKSPAENRSIRARSSPLRRLLDPILKPKTQNQHRSVETFQPLKMNFNSISSHEEEKHKITIVHARLQVTVKNGLPLFKFVVDNNSNILAATVTKSGNNDSSQSFTLYSVNEIKKKSGSWMTQGSKEKSCGFTYTIAGQMKVSQDLRARESVLFGMDVRQTGQESPKAVPNRELGAIVLKNSNDLREDKNSSSTTVILPGGIHGLPIKGGAPSPLLDRWRSGGLCDCGGWDLGCKICVLSSKDCPDSESFDLFVQGGDEENKRPYFKLSPLKNNIYSVEFKASISFLQALFICVAVKSGKKTYDMIETNHLPEARNLVTCPPPLSPVERV